uniref:Secreted protein n=1 Tax=Oryza meridionalis TaxID=40149 RepID=A0A0E0DPF6_9ORYZ
MAGALIVFLGHPLGMGDGGCCEGRVGGCHVGPSKKPGLEILLVGGDVESKCVEVGWVRSLWFRFDGVMNMC